MTDLDIIYQIFREKTYLEPSDLDRETKKISNLDLRIGVLVDFMAKHQRYNTDRKAIEKILNRYETDLDRMVDLHTNYINILLADPRSPLEDFLFKFEGDLAENDDFVSWVKSLSDSDLDIVENYCTTNEYYEIIDFILKARKPKSYIQEICYDPSEDRVLGVVDDEVHVFVYHDDKPYILILSNQLFHQTWDNYLRGKAQYYQTYGEYCGVDGYTTIEEAEVLPQTFNITQFHDDDTTSELQAIMIRVKKFDQTHHFEHG